MKKVLIIGCPGSGKTTFGIKLAERTGLPLIHLDKLYHMDNWQRKISKEEADRLIQSELEKDEWILDGNYNRTLAHRLSYCDTVFYLDFSVWVCLWGAIIRTLKYYGRTRDDVSGNCPEKFNKNKLNFFKFIINFNREHREKYYNLLSQSDARVIVFKNRKEIERYLGEKNDI